MAQAARIHLLLAVPVDWPAFQRAAYDPARDWLRDCAHDPQRHWRAHYQRHVAEPLRQLAEDARALGAQVHTEARLVDLAAATQEADAVIVLAHWKGELPGESDLPAPDPAALATLLARERELLPLAQAMATTQTRTQAVALLREHVQHGPAAAPRGSFEEVAHPGTRAAQRREQLDHVLAPDLRPGNRLELADGLHSAHAVEMALHDGFSGVLDLSCCQGRVLADHIDRQRLGSCGVVQFEQDLMPDIAALALLRTLQRCLVGGEPYLAARDAALRETHAALIAEAGAEALAAAANRWAPWSGLWQRVQAWARERG